jgi:hypothetical protein
MLSALLPSFARFKWHWRQNCAVYGAREPGALSNSGL